MFSPGNKYLSYSYNAVMKSRKFQKKIFKMNVKFIYNKISIIEVVNLFSNIRYIYILIILDI